MTLKPATNRQVPDNSILDSYGKQAYLGNRYNGTYSAAVASTSETLILLLSNPAVTISSFPASYVSLFCDLRKLSVLTASQSGILRFYLSPTVTDAGTPQTPVNLRPASPNTGVGVLTTGPTVSSNGTLVGVLGAATEWSLMESSLIILDPGQKLLVTAQVSTNPTTIATQLEWNEI